MIPRCVYQRQFANPVPRGLALDHTRRLLCVSGGYVDSNHRIHIYYLTNNTQLVRTLGTGAAGAGVDQFNYPTGLAIDESSGVLFVADHWNHRIVCYDVSSGTRLRIWGSQGQGVNQFNQPSAIALDSRSQLLFITDCVNHRIQVYTREGTFVRSWGVEGSSAGQLKQPRGIAIDSTRSLVYVSEAGNHRISVFNTDGVFVRIFGG